ncbi:tetratricopeptide repeat protein 12 [Drosophila sulfurigaster albostrigata]|uniref:tetratricopeptide repeat protein 12 n=1 Tax=Drosophila sulfurigaster albostrigata TaxID=89887 RepID=UPI002D21B0C1|nr:tetratricopeptide repeat protein 12 [Drosophila sulfurigaster albostrigata]
MDDKHINDFADFESTLQKIEDILQNKGSSAEDESVLPKAKTAEDFENLDVDKVHLTIREDRTVINKSDAKPKEQKGNENTMDQQSFMKEVERDANERAQSRAKREHEAEGHRCQGNEAFRKGSYEKAILHYNKAVERVKDSAITYNNRALCYIRLRNYKRALDDCQYVLHKLQETNLRAWLYRAKAYKCLKDVDKFEESVAKARQHNPKQLSYIDKFIGQIEDEM